MTSRTSIHLSFAKSFALTVAMPLAIWTLLPRSSLAQGTTVTPDANPPLTFDVVSIKPATQDGGIDVLPGGGVNFRMTAYRILSFAYEVRDFQIANAPGWMKTERYEIKAKVDGGAPSDVRQLNHVQFRTMHSEMMQRTRSLLIDRFQLKVHRETKELPLYALVQVKSGHKLTANNASEGEQGIRLSRSQLTAQRMPLHELCNALVSLLDRPVVNQTGLEGNFDYKLEWTADPSPSPPGDSPESAAGVDSAGPSLSAALLQQLGLRLESKKGPVEVLVIDRVSKPSEN